MSDRYKRPFDLAAVVAAIVLLFPFWLLAGAAIALAIRIEDGGPVLYRQTRLGRRGRPFRILKFRTMVVGAENRTGPVRAARRDARVTAVGRLLRRFHLDELPQVVNSAPRRRLPSCSTSPTSPGATRGCRPAWRSSGGAAAGCCWSCCCGSTGRARCRSWRSAEAAAPGPGSNPPSCATA